MGQNVWPKVNYPCPCIGFGLEIGQCPAGMSKRIQPLYNRQKAGLIIWSIQSTAIDGSHRQLYNIIAVTNNNYAYILERG